MGSTTSTSTSLRIASPNLRFIFALLFSKETVFSQDVASYRKALALFTCPLLWGGSSLRTKQVSFFVHDAHFHQNKKVINRLLRNFLSTSSFMKSGNYLNTSNTENAFRVHPDGKQIDSEQGSKRAGLPEMELSPEFIRNLRHWFYNTVQGVGVFLGKQLVHGVGHAVVLILQKKEGHLCTWYFNTEVSRLPLSGLFKKEVQKALGLEQHQVVDQTPVFTCPLQNEVQGGNCKQWSLLVLLSILFHPGFLDRPSHLYDLLLQDNGVNIMMFELYLFFVSHLRFEADGISYKELLLQETADSGPFFGSDSELTLEHFMSAQELTPCFVEGVGLESRGLNTYEYVYSQLLTVLQSLQARGFSFSL